MGPSEPWPDNRDSLPSAFPWMGERRPSKHSLLGSWEVLASWRQRGGSIPLCFFAVGSSRYGAPRVHGPPQQGVVATVTPQWDGTHPFSPCWEGCGHQLLPAV